MSFCSFAALVLFASVTLRADEGLWLFNQFPRAEVQKKYGIEVSDSFLAQLQHSSVRFNSGGSGSFVSPDGLLFTNHHVGADCIQKMSSKEHDYLKEGFLAKDYAGEKACPDLEVNVLLKISDITGQVKAGIAENATPAEDNRARRANIARIEKDCGATTGNRCDVVTLYAGGMYNLYEYKKYTDIRLVFAPEFAIAFFGGDPENFTFPRYALDICFFRAYENDKPVRPQHYLPFSRQGAKENELTFVSGHPGSTSRLFTMAQIEFARDVTVPFSLRRTGGVMKAAMEFGRKGPEEMRQRNDIYFGASNSFKAYTGFANGLNDPGLMDRKRQDEGKVKDDVLSDPAKTAKYGRIWDDVAAAVADVRTYYNKYYCYENVAFSTSELMWYGKTLERMAAEDKKPNGERLKEFTDSGRPALEQMLYSKAPIYPGLEAAMIAESFRFIAQELGPDDPVLVQALSGRKAEEVAEEAVKTSRLADPEFRKRLATDPAVRAAAKDDGILKLVRAFEGPAREYRKRYEDDYGARLAMISPKLAQARYDVYGAREYPDATFTLRLTFGPAIGYTELSGRNVPWATEMGGIYPHSTGIDPLALPDSWLKAKKSIDGRTAFNFVTTCDIHGGNSGSPTVNAKGEIVGIVFDGNLESLPNRYMYDSVRARSVHVASQGIVEALRKVYKANRVAKELGF